MSSVILDTLGITAVVASVLVITAHSPVVSVMYLIGVFIVAACYLVCLGVTFVGLTYLVVYVGAVAVLFLFVIMILNVRLSEVVSVGGEYTKNLPLALIIGSVFIFEIVTIINTGSDNSTSTFTSGGAGQITFNLINYINSFVFNINNTGVNFIENVHLTFSMPVADITFGVGGVSQVQALGLSLYTYGAFWLFIVSIILLLAIMGPIALCMRISRSN